MKENTDFFATDTIPITIPGFPSFFITKFSAVL